MWNADERFRQAYLVDPGYYKTGDAGFIDQDGYVSVMTRVDDVINVAGHRLSTGQIEEVLGSHNDVAECAVIGVADELKGQVPFGFLVLKAASIGPRKTVREVVQLVRDRIGPVAFFKTAIVVPRLPKTRSGKILRGTCRRSPTASPGRCRHHRGPGRPRRDHRRAEDGGVCWEGLVAASSRTVIRA